jgi:hypothetical protein
VGSRLLAAPFVLVLYPTPAGLSTALFPGRKISESGNTVTFFLHLVKNCATLSVVLSAPRQAVPPRRSFSIGGETTSFYPQSIKREGVADMNVTWSDLIQFCILIFAILAYAENKKK